MILIGELRDAETAQTALQAAESGHLVFSTLHTIDAAETIGRMIEFFPPREAAADPLDPRRRRCAASSASGCSPRIGGGRVPAVEVMVDERAHRDLIREDRADEIPDAIADGEFFEMQTFSQALIDLVLAGRVDRETAANAATNRHDFEISLDRAQKLVLTKKLAAEAATETEPEADAAERVQPAPSRDDDLPALRVAGG